MIEGHGAMYGCLVKYFASEDLPRGDIFSMDSPPSLDEGVPRKLSKFAKHLMDPTLP